MHTTYTATLYFCMFDEGRFFQATLSGEFWNAPNTSFDAWFAAWKSKSVNEYFFKFAISVYIVTRQWGKNNWETDWRSILNFIRPLSSVERVVQTQIKTQHQRSTSSFIMVHTVGYRIPAGTFLASQTTVYVLNGNTFGNTTATTQFFLGAGNF